jgi:hypothetical protein
VPASVGPPKSVPASPRSSATTAHMNATGTSTGCACRPRRAAALRGAKARVQQHAQCQ